MAMAALDGDVRKSLLDRTDAEKAFRPWWDAIEDLLLNTLIGLGKKNQHYSNLHSSKAFLVMPAKSDILPFSRE